MTTATEAAARILALDGHQYDRMTPQATTVVTPADGPPTEDEPIGPWERWTDATYTLDGLKTIPPPSWLIDGLLPANSLTMLYGPSGQGKTFVALDIALSVAYGLDWHNMGTKAGHVVYVAAEGATGLSRRVGAWQAHHQPTRTPAIEVLTEPVHLFANGIGSLFAQWCAQRSPALVIIDTLARCSLGAEENSAKDAGQLVDALDQIRRATAATVIAVHHSGKDFERGARGSTALRGAMDTELAVTAAGQTLTIRTTKQKDAAEGHPIQLELVEAAGSCALTTTTGTGLVSSGALQTLAALRQIEIPGGISSGAWMDTAGVSKPTFHRHRAALIRARRVENIGSDRAPRYVIPADEDTAE